MVNGVDFARSYKNRLGISQTIVLPMLNHLLFLSFYFVGDVFVFFIDFNGRG